MWTTYSVPSRLSHDCGTRCEDTTVPTITACESFFSRSTGIVLVHAAKEAAAEKIQANPMAIRFNLPRSTQLNNDPTIGASFLCFKPLPNQETHLASHQSCRDALLLPAAENEGTVRSAETKGVRKSHIQWGCLRPVGGVVEIADRIGIVKVGSGRNDLALQGHDGDAGLETAGAAQQMTSHRLGRAYPELAAGRVFLEQMLDRRRLQGISQRSGSGMRIYVVHISRPQFGAAQGILHCSKTTFSFRRHAGDVISIRAHTVANNLRQDVGFTCAGMFQLLQDQDAGPFTNDETIAVFIERAAGMLGIFIAGGERAHGSKPANAHR